MEFLGAPSGLGEHDLTRVNPHKTASRTDEIHHLEHVGAGTAANIEDCRSRCQRDPFQHQPLARLDRRGLLCLIHELNEEVRVLGAVDLREEVGMGMRAQADPLASTEAFDDVEDASNPSVLPSARRAAVSRSVSSVVCARAGNSPRPVGLRFAGVV
jgi:hypothetical protein